LPSLSDGEQEDLLPIQVDEQPYEAFHRKNKYIIGPPTKDHVCISATPIRTDRTDVVFPDRKRKTASQYLCCKEVFD
jgi:hypothetical protein